MNTVWQFLGEYQVLTAAILTACAGMLTIVVGKMVESRCAARQAELAAAGATASCNLVTLYCKVIRWHVHDEGSLPLYNVDATRIPELPTEVEVYDETLYTNVAVYDKPATNHEYIFRGSGVVDLLCLYPWRDRLRFADKGAAYDAHTVRQAFSDQPSNGYVMVTHAYNGLQPGHEDFAVRMPIDTSEGRLVVDLSSVPHIINAMMRSPRAELRAHDGAEVASLQVYEYRRGIYTIEAKSLKKDDVLFLDLTIDWQKLCKMQETTSSAMGH